MFAHGYIVSSILIEYYSFSKRLIWLIAGTLTGTITPGQNGHKNNGNGGVYHNPQNSRTGTSPLWKPPSVEVVLFISI